MSVNNGHIISRLSWNTSFDNKDRAFELQERLSNWSRIHMPNVVSEVFNELCPPEQTWRINRLQLNLGAIELDNFETGLMVQIRKQLQEQLSNLVTNPGADGNNIEIYHENKSYLKLIENYLLFGFMPWTYKINDSSLNDILSEQLQNNRQNVIARIRKLGTRIENVRKRIAWQVREDNIIAIIKGLEPNNHEQILIFSEEMVKVQQKGNVVQAGSREFTKHIWHWILNYLLAERGTIFNRIAFAKSTIIQMAAYYNIGYEELLNIIEQAIKIVAAKHGTVKPEFIKTLQLLFEENVSGHDTTVQHLYVDNWTLLHQQLQNPALIQSLTQINTFNGLISDLGKNNKEKLWGLINSSVKDNGGYGILTKKLNPSSLEFLISQANKNHSALPLDIVLLMERLGGELGLNITRKEILEIALRSMTGELYFDKKTFINNYIHEFVLSSNTSQNTTLHSIISANAFLENKSNISHEVYAHIIEFITNNKIKADTILSTEQILEIGLLINKIINGLNGDKTQFILLKNAFKKSIMLWPAASFTALKAFVDKTQLYVWLPFIVDLSLANKLILSYNKEADTIIYAIRSALKQLTSNGLYATVAKHAEEHLTMASLEILLSLNKFNAQYFITAILQKLFRLSNNNVTYFTLLSEQLHQEKIIAQNSNIKATLSISTTHKKLPLLKQAEHIIDNTTNRQEELSKMLYASFMDRDFIVLRKTKNKMYKKVLRYLMLEAEVTMERLCKENVGSVHLSINKTQACIREELENLFWKCLLNYPSHIGNIKLLIQNFRIAMQFIYPPKKDILPIIPGIYNNSDEIVVTMKSGDKLSLQSILVMLRKGISDGTQTVSENGNELQLEELLQLALEWSPKQVRNIIVNTGMTQKRVTAMMAIINFSRFCDWINQDTQGRLSDEIQTIQQMYDIFSPIASGEVSVKLKHLFWKTLWQLLSESSNAVKQQNKFINDILHLLTVNMEQPLQRIALELQKNSSKLSNTVLKLINLQFPDVYVTPANSPVKLSGILLKLKRRGLVYDVTRQLIAYRQLPIWMGDAKAEDIVLLLNELIYNEPVSFLMVLKKEIITENQWQWLANSIRFTTLVKAIGYQNKNQESMLALIEKLYNSLESMKIKGISTKELQDILFKKVVKAWVNSNWKILSAAQIWNEILWDCSIKKGIRPVDMIKQLSSNPTGLPPALLISLKQAEHQYIKPLTIKDVNLPIKNKTLNSKPLSIGQIAEVIPVKNAGLVLLNSYIPMLFERLELVTDKKFITPDNQIAAVHYLQYMATGLQYCEEYLMPLNKVLCGLPLAEPITDGITVLETEINLINGLLKAVIGYWPAIGQSSVAGLRGNWLVRDGLLTETEDRWELRVEKRAYDLLINRSPFSFSIIKYGWMNKPIHVTWIN